MIKDMQESEALMKEFKDSESTFDINFFILEQGSWPIRSKMKVCKLPPEIESSQTKFTEFYKARRRGKCLNWLPHMMTALVYAKFDLADN